MWLHCQSLVNLERGHMGVHSSIFSHFSIGLKFSKIKRNTKHQGGRKGSTEENSWTRP